jgi:phage terminase large subunit GpA-like protein
MNKALPDLFRRSFAPRKSQSVHEWAEQNVVLNARTDTPWPGPYTTAFCPFVREPQDTLLDYGVRIVTLCWSTRSSKTETVLNPIRYCIAEDPQPWLIAMSSENNGKYISRKRLQPSIDDSPVLSKEKPDNPDLYATLEMHLKRCSGYIIGANSPGNAASKGIGLAVCDEIDKYPQQQTKETGALQLILERLKERWNSKAFLTSTPTLESAQIWTEFLKTDQRYWHVACLNCGEYQTMRMDQLKWDSSAKESEGKWNFVKVRQSARYECEKCGFAHRDPQKVKLLQSGLWRATNNLGDPELRGHHLNALVPSWIPFGKVATAFLQSFSSPEDKQNFHNSWLALPIGSSEDRLRFETELKKRAEGERCDRVPVDHVAIMTMDVQRTFQPFVVRAWDRNGNSIGLEWGQVPGFEEGEVVRKKWGCPVVFCDMGYAARQREVLEWAATHHGFIPVLGSATLLQPLRKQDMPIDGGLFKGNVVGTLRVRPNDYKEKLHERIRDQKPKWIFAGDPGDDYRKQMSAETRHVRRGPGGKPKVEWIQVSHANHALDCEAMQISGFEFVRNFIFDMSKPETPSTPMPAMERPRIDLTEQEHRDISAERQPADEMLSTSGEDQVW